MSKLFIPTIGDRVRLTADWTFPLHREYRNADLFEVFEPDVQHGYYGGSGLPPTLGVTLPAGTILSVSRIYIRGSGADARRFDSYTFRTVASPMDELTPRKNGGRGKSRHFWAKLSDVNNMEAERFEDA